MGHDRTGCTAALGHLFRAESAGRGWRCRRWGDAKPSLAAGGDGRFWENVLVSACHFLRLDPAAFWRLPFRDLEAALKVLRPGRQYPGRFELDALHRRFPDFPAR
ncbi:MAG: phage tail assembly chaperone [Nitratireductor sp.]|nr:phage tail assembly chaperone [Nitratireductor sp.]